MSSYRQPVVKSSHRKNGGIFDKRLFARASTETVRYRFAVQAQLFPDRRRNVQSCEKATQTSVPLRWAVFDGIFGAIEANTVPRGVLDPGRPLSVILAQHLLKHITYRKIPRALSSVSGVPLRKWPARYWCPPPSSSSDIDRLHAGRGSASMALCAHDSPYLPRSRFFVRPAIASPMHPNPPGNATHPSFRPRTPNPRILDSMPTQQPCR